MTNQEKNLITHRAPNRRNSLYMSIMYIAITCTLFASICILYKYFKPADWTSTPGFNPTRPPASISRVPIMVNGSITNQISWSPVSGAKTYNIYDRGMPLAQGITTTMYVITPTSDSWYFSSYTVTAVVNGVESLPSAPAHMFFSGAILNNAPNLQTPDTPNGLTAYSWWNSTAPIVRIDFHNAHTDAYNLYRDGKKIVINTSMFYCLDYSVTAGSTHTYAVTASTVDGNGKVYESPLSAPVTVKVTSGPVTTVGNVVATQITPNDDSVQITVQPVPGAVDYRAYSVATPNKVKYSGGKTTVELNGLPYSQPSQIVVEALNALGPFQDATNTYVAGTLQPNTTTPYLSINGQGDPVDVPEVIARTTVTFTPVPFTLTGSQAFYDAFHTNASFVQVPLSQIDPNIVQDSIYSGQPYVSEMTNGNWRVRNDQTNASPGINVDGFFLSDHFMHMTSSLVGIAAGFTFIMPDGQPNSHPVVPTNQVLHIVTEVDTLSDNTSRWTGVLISPQNDPFILHNNTFDLNNTSIDLRFISPFGDGLMSLGYCDGTSTNFFYGNNQVPNPVGLSNTSGDLDLRHHFDIYVSSTRAKVYADGTLYLNVDLTQATHADGTPVILNWLYNQPLTIAHYSTTYHIPFAERIYNAQFNGPDGDMGLNARYWLNYRPTSDERHWDNMGHEVLTAFP